MTKIFISHSSSDNEFAKQIAEELTGVGIDVWLDLADIPASMKWSTAVQNGLNECDAMILIISPEAMASVNVEDEWQYYFDMKKKVFPIRWKPADVHFQLRRIQYIDFHKKEFAGAFEKLCAELQRNGIALAVDLGMVTEVRSDEATSQPRPADAFPPRHSRQPKVVRGAQTALPRVEDILPPPFKWCEIPVGKVTLEAGGYLKERTTFDVPAFAIATYPITKAQYRIFVNEANGYTNVAWWDYSETAMRWRLGSPKLPDKRRADADLPHTDVSWYDAVAHCRWLTAKTDDPSTVILPTEQQWQRAAQGASRYGILGMSGNVWEWCLTSWATGKNDLGGSDRRCLRGGISGSSVSARAAYRNRHDASNGLSNYGFRVCVSSPSA